MTDKISVLNTQTGAVDSYDERLFRNKVIFPTDVFVRVESGSKPYVKELFKPRSVEEYVADHPVEEPEDEEVVYDDLETEEK